MNLDFYSIATRLSRTYGMIQSCLPLMGGNALPPLFLVLELTYRCNLACNFCYVRRQAAHAHSEGTGRELTQEEIRNVVDQTPPWTVVMLSGGEALLRALAWR